MGITFIIITGVIKIYRWTRLNNTTRKFNSIIHERWGKTSAYLQTYP